jgi:hypothetical protein
VISDGQADDAGTDNQDAQRFHERREARTRCRIDDLGTAILAVIMFLRNSGL